MKPRFPRPPGAHSLAGTLHVRPLLEHEHASASRFDSILEQLTEAHVDALRGILGANDTIELLRKLYRLAAASVEPGSALDRALCGSWQEFLHFSLELSAFRRFIERLAGHGADPRTIASEIEREEREWLLTLLEERFGGLFVRAVADVMVASERGTQEGDALLTALVRMSVDVAISAGEGAISEAGIDAAVACLTALRERPRASNDSI